MRFGYENKLEPYLFWVGLWAFAIHDDGWVIINRRRVVVYKGTAPNTGFRRPWWQRRTGN